MRARRLKSFFLAAAATSMLIAPTSAQAWGDEGHSLIMRLAYQGLSPQLRARFDAIMTGANIRHEYDHMDNRSHQMVHEDCRADSLELLAKWADCVRYDSNPHYGSTRPYHFDDIPFYPPMPAWGEWCEREGCGTLALGDSRSRGYFRTLRESRDPVERLEALAYVVHFVADLHQPLHTITNRDSGGNLITVAMGRRRTNLHSFWDSGLFRLTYRGNAEATAAVLASVRRNENAWGQEMDPRAWVRESHEIAVDAYRRLQRVPPKNRGAWNGGQISRDYIQHFAPIMEEQLGKAVVRLRNTLARELG
jgi:hypothetical protein